MKSNSQQTAVDWSRAKTLHSDLKSHARLSLAGQILLGKELVSLKKKLGFTRGGDRHGTNGPNGHCVRLIGNASTWEELCISELGVSDRTVRRWVQCFQTALERSKRNLKSAKDAEARKLWNAACRLLEIPAEELTGDELEELGRIVEHVAADETQASLLADLGKEKTHQVPTNPMGKTGSPGRTMAIMTAESLYHQFEELTRAFDDKKQAVELMSGIADLPLADPDPEKLTLFKFKGMLEDILHGKVVGKLVKMVDDAIESQSHATGKAPKSPRRSKAR